ncbi:lipase ZK262.3-like [Hibiscus syriacus]|uniref:lipase ZK262.3-like n=1 Tax=Hibiscus syriacus TaxID=106335 RepID=UPI001922228F|nr:lipase ZK262.3-like [Hibiscus syriacus]
MRAAYRGKRVTEKTENGNSNYTYPLISPNAVVLANRSRTVPPRRTQASILIGAPRSPFLPDHGAKDDFFDDLTSLIASSCGRELQVKNNDKIAVYNRTLATILVEYASAVYASDLTELFTWTCERCDGLTKGFEVVELVVDVQNCLQGFVGVAKDINAIIIAFRGTQDNSIQNWVKDLFWKQLDLNYPGMPNAMVHHGFYTAYHNTTIRAGILYAVKKAQEFYGDLDIMITGHSMGGAIASFCALDLTVNHEAKNIQVITFGQPRIGNAAFASYGKLVPNTIRVTNEHDIVPHLPPYYTYFPQKTYHHFPTEVGCIILDWEVWFINLRRSAMVPVRIHSAVGQCPGAASLTI